MVGYKATDVASVRRTSDKSEEEKLKLRYDTTVIKEHGAVQSMDFSPVDPTIVAISASAKVQLLDVSARNVIKTFSKFKEAAFGARFRKDGQVLCAGGDEGVVRVFDVEKKTLLRVFKGHQNSVRRCDFFATSDRIASWSDDKTVKIWDVATESLLSTLGHHTDFVRAGAMHPTSPNLILSGSYDHKITLTDTREQREVLSVDSGFPVEDLLFFPSGACIVSAGGNSVQVWDLLAGGKRLIKLVNHHKTVTSLAYGREENRFYSGGIDRHVKVYDAREFGCVGSLDFASGILSLAVSADEKTIVAGSVDGYLTLKTKKDADKTKKKKRKKNGFQERDKDEMEEGLKGDDLVVIQQKKLEAKRKALAKCDLYLRKFEWSKALSLGLGLAKQEPECAAAVLRELIRRGGAKRALKTILGEHPEKLPHLLRFMIRHLLDTRFTSTLIDIGHDLIDVLAESGMVDEKVRDVIVHFQKRLGQAIKFWESFFEVAGAAELILNISSEPVVEVVQLEDDEDMEDVHPTAEARSNEQNFVVEIQ